MQIITEREDGRRRVQTVNDDPSETIESDADQADIKKILQRHGVTGVVEHLQEADLRYGDASGITDYADAMRRVREAETQFMKLPPKVREVFRNDTAEWLDAANDGVNDSQRVQLEKLGYLEPASPAPEADPLESVADPPASD